MAEDKEKVRVADRMRALCSRREYCSADIRKKVMDALDGDAEAADEIVGSLVADKYIDDLRYASAFARDKASISGWGGIKIRYMLSGKGLAKAVIDEALAEIDSVKAADKLYKVIETKAKALKGDPQIRLKLLRFAMGRGYSYEDVSGVINDMVRNLHED